jgi:hypothetical protein
LIFDSGVHRDRFLRVLEERDVWQARLMGLCEERMLERLRASVKIRRYNLVMASEEMWPSSFFSMSGVQCVWKEDERVVLQLVFLPGSKALLVLAHAMEIADEVCVVLVCFGVCLCALVCVLCACVLWCVPERVL